MDQSSTVEAAGENRNPRRVFAIVWWAILLAGLLAFRAVLVPFLLAVVIAYVLSPLVNWLSNRTVAGRQASRWVIVLTLYLCIVALLAATMTIAVPALVGTVRSFARNEVPRLVQQYRVQVAPTVRSLAERFGTPQREDDAPADGSAVDADLRIEPAADGGFRVHLPASGLRVTQDGDDYRIVGPRSAHAAPSAAPTDHPVNERIQAYVSEHTADLVKFGGGLVGGVVGGVFRFFITLMLSAYLLLTEREITEFFRSLVHRSRRAKFDQLLARIDKGLSGVVRGQLAICLVNGLLSGVGFALAKLPYWPLLTAIATVFSLIPIFGAFMSSIPAVLLGLRTGVGTGAFVLLWILGIHQLEANLLNPKILGDAAKIHPFLVVFSLLAGEHFFGILGALLAVPTMSIVQSLFLHWRNIALVDAREEGAASDSAPRE
jgi:predicted PurR-regulated permease PerM